MLVSVIIPIHNAAPFLRGCIDSIINQSYRELEILLIENGSTDESSSICDSYDDSRVKVVHYERLGSGGARNRGLSLARGKYVCFVDADDYVDEKFVSVLLKNILENNVQLSICGYSNILQGSINKVLSVVTPVITSGKKNKELFLTLPISENDNSCPASFYETHYIWGKLFDLSIIKDMNLKFEEDLFVREDMLFLYRYNCKISEAYTVDEPLYYYRTFHNDFIVSAHQVKSRNFLKCTYSVYSRIWETLKEHNLDSKYKISIHRAYCSWSIGSIIRMIRTGMLDKDEAVNEMECYFNRECLRYGLSVYTPLPGQDKTVPKLLVQRDYLGVFEYLS